MASKRAIRRKQCDGKIRYEILPAAKRASLKYRISKGWGERIRAYRCQFCGGYHIGHFNFGG